jgi:AcrR family transcriptional regulator
VYAEAVRNTLSQQPAPAGDAGRQPPRRPPAPRRERKKQRTRDALVAAALELFLAQGYEHTTVREITDAVDVAERTFFRYFAGKEDLALSFVRDGAGALLEALAARPPAEEPLTALRQAFRESLRQIAADQGRPGEAPSYLSALKLIESTPPLLAAHLRYSHDHGEALVRALAEREGVDPGTDPRPRIITVLFGGLVSLANRDWQAAGADDAETMLAAFDTYANQVGPAVSGHWNASDH